MINALDFLHKEGAQNILLTLGDKGSYFYNGKNVYYASALKNSAATGANVAESNAIGTLEKVEEYKKNIQVRKVR